MKRKIVEIDQNSCNGCGLCVTACHEGAIVLEGGKARLVSDIYCDGLGDCLPACPTGAITIIERVADPFDEIAVKEKQNASVLRPSALKQWPIQLHLVNPAAPYLAGADLLLAADCTAFACANMHEQYMKGRVTIIACPKLDDSTGYLEKLTEILQTRNIRSLTVLRMTVPCCSGLTYLARKGLELSGADIPLREVVLNLDGTEA